MAKTNKTRAVLLFTGSELLNGKLNRYEPLFCAELAKLGVQTAYSVTLPDNTATVAEALKSAFKTAPLVIVVGGLGPTFDDVTRDAAARALGRKLILDEKIVKKIAAMFARRGWSAMPDNNRLQALVLDGAKPLANSVGTAPGQFFSNAGRMLVLLPGPESEWRPMFARYVVPEIKKNFPPAAGTCELEVNLSNAAESAADEKLAPVMKAFPAAEFTILSSPGHVRIFARAREKTPARAKALLKKIKTRLFAEFGDSIYGCGPLLLEQALGSRLRELGLTATTAESCTGGLVAHRITRIAGSSDYFNGGVVAYANTVKNRLLGVKSATLKNHGAVSPECALEMARGACKATGAAVGIATTGIAGPGGATPDKPVGLVYIAVSVKGGPETVTRNMFGGGRNHIQECSANAALSCALKALRHK